MKKTLADDDALIGEAAVREAAAQLAIVKVLAKLPQARRERVVRAACHLIEAERIIPGAIEAFLTRGRKRFSRKGTVGSVS